MPELPDITVYIEALERRVVGQRLEAARVASPFLLRTVQPPLDSLHGKSVCELRRLGKRMAIGFDGKLWLIFHLMIAGRLHWKDQPVRLAGKRMLAAFDFANGCLSLTEAGSQRRASLHVVQGEDALAAHNPGGLELDQASLQQFTAALTRANHTLKRALTDPHIVSGIGNAYSDEILHRARLSPVTLTQKLAPEQIEALYSATRETLALWTQRLRTQYGDAFPEGVTAFRPEMAVHGRFGEPCPDCGTRVARIRYATNETNYCPRCQTGGRVLADRSLSRLLKSDWPRSIDQWE